MTGSFPSEDEIRADLERTRADIERTRSEIASTRAEIARTRAELAETVDALPREMQETRLRARDSAAITRVVLLAAGPLGVLAVLRLRWRRG